MPPADQSLEPRYSAGVQVDLWLVAESQLILSREGLPQVADQREPLGAVVIPLGRVHDEAQLRPLRRIHRHIGKPKELHLVGSMLGEQCDAQAGINLESSCLPA